MRRSRVLLVVVAGLAVGRVAALAMAPDAVPEPSVAAPDPAARGESPGPSDVSRLAELFGGPPARGRLAPTPPPAPPAPCPSTFVVRATVVASVEALSSALVSDGHDVRTVWTGDLLDGWQVVGIDRTRREVEVVRDGRTCLVERATAAPVATPRTPTPFAQLLASGGLRVDRAQLEARLSDLAALAADVRVVPSFREGRPVGFKIASLRPGSALDQLGLASGDVVTRIGDLAVDTPEHALTAWLRLRGAPAVDLVLERAGQPAVRR